MSALHWNPVRQLSVGAAGFVMGAGGLIALANACVVLFIAIKTAQGCLLGKHLSSNPEQDDTDFAYFLNKARSKTAPLSAASALGVFVTSFSLLRAAYLLSKAVYLKASPPSSASTLAHIAFACLGLAISGGFMYLTVSIAAKAKDQELRARAQHHA